MGVAFGQILEYNVVKDDKKGGLSMRKFLLATLAVVYTLATLLLALVSYVTIGELRKENADLKNQLASQKASHSEMASMIDVQTVLVDVKNSYCNLVIDHWESDEENLNIVTAYAQAIVVSNAPTATAENAQLVLKLNGELLSSSEITLTSGESSESLEADIKNVSFSIPQLSPKDELELWLEVTLPGHITLSGYGGSWYRQGGTLHLISG